VCGTRNAGAPAVAGSGASEHADAGNAAQNSTTTHVAANTRMASEQSKSGNW